jgi:hypothetical protein
MELLKFNGMWIMLIHDPGSAWQESMPLGSSFEIYQDAAGDYWFRPDPGLKPPMNQAKKLLVDPKQRGEFPFGEPLVGGLYADFGGKEGVTHFTINLVGRERRVISLSHSHGGSHGVDD